MSFWTLQNTQVTGETQWTNASYNVPITIPINNTTPTQFLQVAGYTSGTISFTIDAIPAGWALPQTLQISILGGIQNTTSPPAPPVPESIFTVQTLELYNGSGGDSNLTTFYIEWNIPIEFVALSIFNNTGGPRTITNIRLITESQGGGIGFTSSSGATVGPSTPNRSIQYYNTGVFGGASGALYEATGVGQVQLAAGSEGAPMLAFSDGTHPLGTYDTGIYRVQADTLGIATGGTQQVTVTSSSGPLPANMIRGLNVGTQSAAVAGNVTGIRRLSAVPNNSWEDGNCGNSDFIVFTACDFAGSFTNPTGRAAGAQTFVAWSAASANRSPVVYNGTDPGPALACKLIPKGFVINSREQCFIYSDITTTLTTPTRMFVDVRVQEAAGPNINAPVSIASQTINPATGDWQTAGDGSVNRLPINFSDPLPQEATGTGFNTVNIYVEPQLVMNAINGGIVAFKVPIIRI